MSIVLLDTTVVSFLHPKKNNPIIASYQPHLHGKILALSFQTIAELWAWPEERNWGVKLRNGMNRFLKQFLVIPYDEQLAKTWAKVTTDCKRIGRRLEDGDAWIVATAVQYKLPLLTHDRDQVGLSIPDLSVVTYL
jgi:tRNA(fMet)-specific endonuclease VapC